MKKVKSTLLVAILFAATVCTVSAVNKATEFKYCYRWDTACGQYSGVGLLTNR